MSQVPRLNTRFGRALVKRSRGLSSQNRLWLGEVGFRHVKGSFMSLRHKQKRNIYARYFREQRHRVWGADNLRTAE